MDKISSREPTLPPLPPRRAVQRQPVTACPDGVDAEDEEVEKFYALLDNIRAERHLFKSGQSGCKKKRLRTEEPAWKQAFTLQDFQEAKGDKVGGPPKLGDGASGSEETTSRTGDRELVAEVDLRLTLSLG